MAPDLDRVRQIAADGNHLAVVATTRPDHSVHASLVTAGVFADPVSGEPSVAFVVQGQARKLALLRRSGRASAVYRSGWQWAGVEGPVRIAGPDDTVQGIDPAAIPALLRAVFVAAGGSHDDWDEFDRVMAEERRTAVFIHPSRVTGNVDSAPR